MPSILWELKKHGVPVIYHLNDFKLLCPSYNMVAHGHACEKCSGGKFWHVAAEDCYTCEGAFTRLSWLQRRTSKRLAAAGDDVTVYCRNYFTAAIARHNKMRLVRLPTIRSKHLETVIHTFLSTVHVWFSRCDIVHYHCLGPALFAFIPRLFGKKTMVTVQGLDWKRKKWGRIASSVLRWGEKASAEFADATVVVSQELQQHYRLTHGVETTYIPNGAMLRTRTTGVCLQESGLEPDEYILFLGRFSPERNCHLLVETSKGLRLR